MEKEERFMKHHTPKRNGTQNKAMGRPYNDWQWWSLVANATALEHAQKGGCQELKDYRHMTTLQAREWLVKNDKEAALFWTEQPEEDLIEAVGDNLRDFGDDVIDGWTAEWELFLNALVKAVTEDYNTAQ